MSEISSASVAAVDGKRAAVVVIDGYVHRHRVIGQNVLDALGPLNEAYGSAEEIVFNAYIEGLVKILETVHVKVVYQLGSGVTAIFVDDGKGWRPHGIIAYAEGAAQRRDKGGLAGTHSAVKRKDGIVAHQGDKFAGGAIQVVRRFYSNGLIHSP